MITNKDVRVENGNIVINGDKYPLDGQSPETIMEIVEDNSDSTPTENSTAPITSGGVFTALGTKQDTLTFDTAPTDESINPVTSGGIYNVFAGIAGQIGNLNFAVLEQTFSDVDVNTAWGSLYESASQSFNISSLGLTDPPRAVILSVKDMSYGIIIKQAQSTATAVNFTIMRPSATTGVSANIDCLVIY